MSPGPAGIGPVCPGCTYPLSVGCRCGEVGVPARELTLWIAYLPDGSQWGRPERDAADCLQGAWRELVGSQVEDLAGDFARLRLVRVRVEPVTAAALVAVLGREPGLDAVTEAEELLLRLVVVVDDGVRQ